MSDSLTAPAPWNLRGDGYILFYRAMAVWGSDAGFVDPALQTHFRGGVGAVMLVDYVESPVGPYGELLFIPGLFTLHGHSFLSISKIYVSSQDSIANGQANWRIPKEKAHFERYAQDQTERLVVRQPSGELILDMNVHNKRGRLPVTTAVVPAVLRTIGQIDATHLYQTKLSGRGWLTPAQLLHARVNPAYFPDFTQGPLFTAVRETDFRLTFAKPVLTVLNELKKGKR